MIKDGTWLKFCSISDDAMTKNQQYAIFKLVQQLEPNRSYGYRIRISKYIAANGVKFLGGGYSLADPDFIKNCVRNMERNILD